MNSTPLTAPTEALPFAKILCVGLGLVGGSALAAAKRAWPKAKRIGVDEQAIVAAALSEGHIDVAIPRDDKSALGEALHDVDVVVLALPVLGIIEFMKTYALALQHVRLVIDTGSSKSTICAEAEKQKLPTFVGTHPMAGMAASGLANARASLFEHATWFLCPGSNTNTQATRDAREFVTALGARALEIDAGEHDRLVALTSHMPHLLINGLAEAVLEQGATDAAGGTLRDVMAVAGAPFHIWWETLSTNSTATCESIDVMIDKLEEIKSQLQTRDRMKQLFAQGRSCRERSRRSWNIRD